MQNEFQSCLLKTKYDEAKNKIHKRKWLECMSQSNYPQLTGEPRGTEAKLIRNLMNGYEAKAIPRVSSDKPVTVHVDYTLITIESLVSLFP